MLSGLFQIKQKKLSWLWTALLDVMCLCGIWPLPLKLTSCFILYLAIFCLSNVCMLYVYCIFWLYLCVCMTSFVCFLYARLKVAFGGNLSHISIIIKRPTNLYVFRWYFLSRIMWGALERMTLRRIFPARRIFSDGTC